MRKLIPIAVIAGSLVFAGAGCGDDDSPNGAGATATTTTTTTTAEDRPASESRSRRTTTVEVMRTRFGRMLVDGKGRALYLFTRERGSTARCYGDCAEAWPVFYARGRLKAGSGADGDLIGTTRRRGGRRQVTYDGHPLYYYVTDRRPGQVTCQNVAEFGGTWLVVAPSGRPIV